MIAFLEDEGYPPQCQFIPVVSFLSKPLLNHQLHAAPHPVNAAEAQIHPYASAP